MPAKRRARPVSAFVPFGPNRCQPLLDAMRRSLLFYLQGPEQYRPCAATAMNTRYQTGQTPSSCYEQMYQDALATV